MGVFSRVVVVLKSHAHRLLTRRSLVLRAGGAGAAGAGRGYRQRRSRCWPGCSRFPPPPPCGARRPRVNVRTVKPL